MIETKPSPIEEIVYANRHYLLKRDDLLDRDFSGNKARKFRYFLECDFPHITTLISHGSIQSNAMYSLSVLAKEKGWDFHYYVDHIPSYLAQNPHGNYLGALDNGAIIMIGAISKYDPHKSLFIPEGGCMMEAEYGIAYLASEIDSYFQDERIDIFLPSGTGTTALFLQKHSRFTVYTTPCVGDSNYLRKQFYSLERDISKHPIILDTEKKYHFGKLYREFFEIWIELREKSAVEFDLLYDPKGWMVVKEQHLEFKNRLLYIHQGGLLGNESMLKRYGRKFYEDYREYFSGV